jgi:uncharacterized repeat protein (TIGR02543 family)
VEPGKTATTGGTSSNSGSDFVGGGTTTTTTYAVTLNTYNGTGTALTSYTYGVGATLPTDYVKAGYIFDGWYTNADFTGSPVTAITTTDSGDKTFYAKWTAFAITAVAPETASVNKGKYSFTLYGTAADKVAVLTTTEDLAAYDSATTAQGNGKWVGILVTLNKPIIGLYVKTSGNWGALTADDVTEAQDVGATGNNTFVWWIKSEQIANADTPKTISVRDGESGPIETLTVVDKTFISPTTDTDYIVVDASADGSVAKLKTKAAGAQFDAGSWYYVADPKYAGYFSTIDQQNNGQYNDLFVLTLGGTAEKLTLMGDPQTGEKTINVGLADGSVNVLPPVEIPYQGLGISAASSPYYQSVNIVVNNGVYLNIDAGSNNTATGFGQGGYFKNGTLTVDSGAKVRDSAWYGFPLGPDSAIVVLEGGYLAVGEGDATGDSTNNVYDGWIIAPVDTANAWIQLAGTGVEPGGGTRIEIINTPNNNIAPVLLYGKAIVSGYVNLFYDIFVSAGSEVIVRNTGELVQHDAAQGAAKIYGQQATGASVPSGFANAPASKITIEGAGEIDSNYLANQESFKTFTATGTTTSVATKTPIQDGSPYYINWVGVPAVTPPPA